MPNSEVSELVKGCSTATAFHAVDHPCEYERFSCLLCCSTHARLEVVTRSLQSHFGYKPYERDMRSFPAAALCARALLRPQCHPAHLLPRLARLLHRGLQDDPQADRPRCLILIPPSSLCLSLCTQSVPGAMPLASETAAICKIQDMITGGRVAEVLHNSCRREWREEAGIPCHRAFPAR